jgi:ubiquinone/menaquinone biosynthesis C-methylase UbiE
VDPAAYEVVHELEESHWFFVGRRNILRRLLNGLLAGVDAPRILDVGCGTGATMRFLEQFGEVTGMDVSSTAIEYCRQQGRERLCLADGESLPFADESFDLVAALDMLEHLEHESEGLSEAWRVLKDGGHALLVVPAFGFLWSDFDRFSGHYRRYSREELRRKIEGSGFEVSRLSYFNTLLFPLVWAVRTFKNWAGRWRTFRSDLEMPVSGLNGILARIFSLESGLIAAGDLPFGVSLVCVATKRSA